MQITVFGASGKVGSLVVEEALRRGYTVVAFVHSHDLFSPSGKLIVQKGDVYNAADVARAVRGSDAVISCLGSWGTKGRDVLTRATANIIPAMVDQKITRIVTLTGIGVQTHPSTLHKLMLRLLWLLPAGKVFQDAETHVRLLSESSLDWTTICSPVMNNLGGAGYRLDSKIGFPTATISRGSVVAALLDQLDITDYLRKTPVVHRK
jgi:putative NADH-flavin reductase